VGGNCWAGAKPTDCHAVPGMATGGDSWGGLSLVLKLIILIELMLLKLKLIELKLIILKLMLKLVILKLIVGNLLVIFVIILSVFLLIKLVFFLNEVHVLPEKRLYFSIVELAIHERSEGNYYIPLPLSFFLLT